MSEQTAGTVIGRRCGIEGCRGTFRAVPYRAFTNTEHRLRVAPTRCDTCGQDSAEFLPLADTTDRPDNRPAVPTKPTGDHAMTDNHTHPTPAAVDVGDCDVHALVGHPGAVLVYAPGHQGDPGDIESDYAVMPEAEAVADDWHVVARTADVLARFGPAPLEDDEAHDAADAINAGTL